MQKLQATLKASILIKSDDSQRRFLAQHSFAIMLEQCCNYSKQCRNNVSLRSKRFQSSYCANVRAGAKKKKRWKGEGEGFLLSPPPPPSFLFFFALVPAFWTNLARKRLLRRLQQRTQELNKNAYLPRIHKSTRPPHTHTHTCMILFIMLCKVVITFESWSMKSYSVSIHSGESFGADAKKCTLFECQCI